MIKDTATKLNTYNDLLLSNNSLLKAFSVTTTKLGKQREMY